MVGMNIQRIRQEMGKCWSEKVEEPLFQTNLYINQGLYIKGWQMLFSCVHLEISK